MTFRSQLKCTWFDVRSDYMFRCNHRLIMCFKGGGGSRWEHSAGLGGCITNKSWHFPIQTNWLMGVHVSYQEYPSIKHRPCQKVVIRRFRTCNLLNGKVTWWLHCGFILWNNTHRSWDWRDYVVINHNHGGWLNAHLLAFYLLMSQGYFLLTHLSRVTHVC